MTARADRRRRAPRAAANVVCLALLAAGIASLRRTPIGASFYGAVRGALGELHATGPALLAVAAATAAIVASGACAARLVTRSSFDSWEHAIVDGAAAAIVVAFALLVVAGSAGAFRRPALVAVHAGMIAAGARWGRPFVRVRADRVPFAPRGLSALAVAVWAMPVLTQLASPVPPFIDVLPNHVAPVEHVYAFGGLDPLTTMPSPIYGPSRQFLGFVGLLGGVSALTRLHAAAAVAAFTLPLEVLLSASGRRIATAVGGSGAGAWTALTLPLTFTFLRLTDVRATVLVFVPALAALAAVATHGSPWSCGSALAAAMLVHPPVGVLTAATIGLFALLRAGGRPFPFSPAGEAAAPAPAALGGAAAAALPQAAVTAGVALPLPVAAALLAGAPLAGAAAARVPLPRPRVVASVLAALAVGSLVVSRDWIPAAAVTAFRLVSDFPLLSCGAVAGAVVLRRRSCGSLLAVWLASGIAASTASALLPATSLVAISAAYETPKVVAYWVSVALAVASATGLAALPRLPALPIAAAFVIVATLPLRPGTAGISSIDEHRLSESASISLRHAETGYFLGYPDERTVVDEPRAEIIDALRDEPLGPRTRVLHVVSSFQQWVSTPVGVFTGALETDVSLDPEHSVHTVGGRLYGLGDLPRLLSAGFDYVLLEPLGLPDVVPLIDGAGYERIFANGRGIVYRKRR